MAATQGRAHGAGASALDLQAAIVELLDEYGGEAEAVVYGLLRSRLRSRGLPLPPDTWLLAVAGEIAADRLYVVATGSVPPDYATSDAAWRAARRLSRPDPVAGPAPLPA